MILIQPIKQWITDIGRLGLTLKEIFGFILQGKIEWAEMLAQIERGGIGSLPIVSLSASFIGMAVSVQFAKEIVGRFGASNLVGGFVALAMLRELAPVFVAIVLAGNIGASITAEIGAMKVTDQIDAMEVFHIHPLVYLVVPRLLATMISGPLLTVYGAFLAIFSGQIFTAFVIHVPPPLFWDSVKWTITSQDILNMSVKSLVFSIAIALISTLNGLATAGTSESVGIQTTKTVIYSLLAIFMLNYILTSIFFRI